MSKLATYFKESVSVLKKGFAYARVVPVLLLALLKRLTGDGFYEVSFTKIGRKWYCNVHEAVQDAIHTDRRCILQRPQRVLHRGDMTLPRHPLPPGPLSRAHPHLQNQQEPSALPHIFRVKSGKETPQGPHRAMCDTAPGVVCISREKSLRLLLAALYHTAAAWLVLQILGFYLYTCQFWVYEDTAAILAHDDLLASADIQLALGRNLVEAATACVALNVNHGQAVA